MTRRIGAGLLLVALLAGCGRTGFPVPPDDYGIGVRLQAERKKEELARKEQEAREAAAARKADEDIVVPTDEPILPEMRPLTGR